MNDIILKILLYTGGICISIRMVLITISYFRSVKQLTYGKETENQVIDEIVHDISVIHDKIEQGTIKKEKTCKNVSEMNPVDGFTCSECGISLVDYVEERVDEEEYDTTYHEYEIKYCPNCGAKVVEE